MKDNLTLSFQNNSWKESKITIANEQNIISNDSIERKILIKIQHETEEYNTYRYLGVTITYKNEIIYSLPLLIYNI